MIKKNLIIPIEIKSRELDGAICLAEAAIKNNWRVIIGQKQQIWPFIKNFPNSFFFLKSIVPGEMQNLSIIKKHNHIISTLDIEGLVLGREPLGIVRRFSRETVKITDIIFYWGKYQYRKVKKIFPLVNKKSFVTGSPIIDSWKIQSKKIKKIKKKNSILISMNFARSDPKLSKIKYLVEKKTMGDLKFSREQQTIFDNEYLLKEISFEKFIEMTEFLARKLQNYKITIRPHPEENIQRYKYLEKYKNVKIDNISSRIQQLIENKIFIHFNSTMSVQANFFKNKVIMYNPVKNKNLLDVLSPVPKNISLQAKNLRSLVKKIKNKNNYKTNSNLGDLLHLWNASFLSSDKIISIFEKYFKDNNYQVSGNLNDLYSISAYFNYIKFNLNIFTAIALSYLSIIMPQLRKKFNNRRYHFYMFKKKWPSLTINELKYYFKKKVNSAMHLRKLKIKKHFSGFYIIENKTK